MRTIIINKGGGQRLKVLKDKEYMMIDFRLRPNHDKRGKYLSCYVTEYTMEGQS
jgi:hypothetical protein